ncbi:ATP-dependent zinc metalloprotease FtsH [Candidatus Gracilibacteria bacterium]|nr:ATP-dependent zinc metalloprotease FtsH [Candidatus Gracilibacteria bacterium]MBF0913845.1 ATP-dependent zinc metalloprotease FtsH [Candidatus Gracilibacteria bacterium]
MTKKEGNKKKDKNGKEFGVKNDKKTLSGFFTLVMIAIVISMVLSFLNRTRYVDRDVSFTQFIQNFNSGAYKEALMVADKAILTVSGGLTEENGIKIQKRDIATIPQNKTPEDLGLDFTKGEIKYGKDNSAMYLNIAGNILFFLLVLGLGLLFIGKMGGMANNAMTFGKSRARLYDPNKDKVLFKDVAGADEEKEELQEVVQFLKNPKKFKDLGAKIPKGVLLVGPPGTGKTMLARAVAGESGVPFVSISGSEFVEMFVGVGASRVRDLFQNAKKMAPAIIFIDEIDAIGKKRGPGTGGGHDEREQTLNQILTEMDGFDNDTNLIVMGATNRVDVLDKALLRPGRFDRKITVNLPNINDREAILKIHASTRKVAPDINFKDLASKTVGFSGADLGNLINESAIIAARYNEKEISEKRIDEAFERLVMGLRKKSQVMNDLEKKITSYHEVGHAIVGKLLPNTDPVHKVSIVSRGGALGVTWFLPERDELLVSKAKYLDELATLYGGRAAEEIFFGKDYITTGASNDIERATSIARQMVTRYGMIPEIGAENFEGEIDRYSGDTKRPFVSDETIKNIDQKVKEILKNAYDTAIKIITENKELHDKIAKDLLEKEELSKEEFDAYFTKES